MFSVSLLRRVVRPAGLVRQLSASATAGAAHPSESFLSGENAVYVENMYDEWKKDPNSVHVVSVRDGPAPFLLSRRSSVALCSVT